MFTGAELEFLTEQPRGRLVTLGADGAPQVHPVVFSIDASAPSLDIIGETLHEAKKFRNVRRDPRVTLTVEDPALPLQGVEDRTTGRGLRIRGLAETDQTQGWDVIRVLPVRVDVWNLVSVGHRSRFFA
jgi:pyridoxamine 5'-phosphate oxidase family protein